MNRRRRSYKLPPDVEYAFNEFRRTGDSPKLNRDLDVCIEREYNLLNKITSWLKCFWQRVGGQ